MHTHYMQMGEICLLLLTHPCEHSRTQHTQWTHRAVDSHGRRPESRCWGSKVPCSGVLTQWGRESPLRLVQIQVWSIARYVFVSPWPQTSHLPVWCPSFLKLYHSPLTVSTPVWILIYKILKESGHETLKGGQSVRMPQSHSVLFLFNI